MLGQSCPELRKIQRSQTLPAAGRGRSSCGVTPGACCCTALRPPRACRQSAARPATPLQTLCRPILTILKDNSVTTAAAPTSFWQRE